MNRHFAAALLLCLTLFSAPLMAQTGNATLSGTIEDVSKALLPGVTVRVVNTATGVESATVSNETGAYSFASLQPGVYRVSATLPGFQTYTYNNFELGTSEQKRLNFTLQISSLSSTVEVSIDASQLLSVSGNSVGEVLTENKVRDLPLVGRDVLDLIGLMPGVTGTGGGASFAGISASQGGVNTTRDGISVSDGRYDNGVYSATRINPDLVGEVRVILAPADAELGRGAGQVMIQTRSGTNRFSGSAVWNVQNSALNANTWANNRQRPTATQPNWSNQHQYTISYGGPIIRNKTFFFALFDGQTYYTRSVQNVSVLTETARKGLFRFYPGVNNGDADTNTSGTGQNLIAAVVDINGNPVRPAVATGDLMTVDVFGKDPNRPGFDKTGFMQKLLSKMPLPNNFTNGGDGLNTATYQWVRSTHGTDSFAGTSDTNNRKQINIKVDQNFSANHKANVNWTYEIDDSVYVQSSWPGGFNGEVFRRPQVITANFTSTLSANIVNEARFGLRKGVTNAYEAFDNRTTGKDAMDYMLNLNGYPIMVHPTSFAAHMINCPVGCGSLGNTTPLWTYGDNLSWNVGKHRFKSGVEIRLSRTNGWNSDQIVPHATGGAGNAPVVGINGGTGGNIPGLLSGANQTAMRNLLLTLSGSLDRIDQAFSMDDPNQTEFKDYKELYRKYRDFHQNEWRVFFKDDWNITRDLTLNVGMGYEFFGVPFISTGLTPAPVGGGMALFGYTGRSFDDWMTFGAQKADLTTVEFVGPNSPNPKRQLWKNDWNNFQPAVGFTWAIPWFGEGKTSFGAGYGVSHQGGGRGLSLDTDVGSMPGINDFQIYRSAGYMDLSNMPMPVPKNKPLLPIPVDERTKTISAYDPNYVNPYIQSFNANLTRTLPAGLILNLRYVGTKGTKLFGTLPINAANFRTNGLFEALEITRAGDDAVLFDRMLQGLNINPSLTGWGRVGIDRLNVPATDPNAADNGKIITGSMALRANTTYNGNIANGNYAAVASSLNTTTAVTGKGGGWIRNGNTFYPGMFPENFIAANPQFATVNFRTNPGSSTYHSLQTGITMRPKAGFSYQGTYVWAKGLATGTTGYTDPTNRIYDHTLQASNRKHSFRSNGTFQLPIGPNKLLLGNSSGILARVVEGWQATWIMNMSSGAPLDISGQTTLYANGMPDIVAWMPKGGRFTEYSRQSTTGDTLFGLFPDGAFGSVDDPQCAQVTTRQNLRNQCTINALTNAATGAILLQNAKPGTQGNLGQNVLEGIGSFSFDASASKTFKVAESKQVQFRIDAQNVLNHPSPTTPTLSVGSANFGQITTKTGNRQFQAQLRLTF